MLIVAPGVVHAAPCCSDDAVLAFYMMRANTFKRVFWNQLGDDNLLSKFFRIALEGEAPASYLYFETSNDPEIRRLLLQIYREHQLEEPYAPQMVNALMRLLFLLMLRRYEGTARLPRTEFFFWKHQYSAILSYIQTHYQETTLDKVSKKFNYSSKQVSRIVKDCTGEAFGDVIRGMKMKKAAELLLDRRYPPEQLRRWWGLPPSTAFIALSRITMAFRHWNGWQSNRISEKYEASGRHRGRGGVRDCRRGAAECLLLHLCEWVAREAAEHACITNKNRLEAFSVGSCL